MIKNKTLYFLCFISILCFLLIPASVFASGGDGTGNGDGSGQGKNKDIVLTLESSSIKNNSSDVAVNEVFQLNFNKNVCNITTLSNNKMCFHLTDINGNSVPIKIIFPDTQLQQKYKRQVFIIPQQDLESNSQYRIAIDRTLCAKNGTTIDDAHTITFTTGSNITDNENRILKSLGDNIVTYETSYNETEDSVPLNKAGLDEAADEPVLDTGAVAKLAVIILIFVIIAFSIILVLLKRRKE